MMFNFVSSDPGTGKTLVQHFINSIYGNSKQTILRKNDTLNARYDRMGVHCNLPICFDELTNLNAADTSELAYSISEGRAKNRMEASANKERVNNAWWQTLVAVSSNASLADKLTVSKSTADAELHRIMEFPFQKPEELDPDFAQELASILFNNYGHAGDIYLKAIVRDVPGTRELMKKVRKVLNRELGTQSSERVWIASFCSMITGGYIAKSLGIIDWDIEKLFKMIIKIVKQKRGEAEAEKVSFNTVIGEYLSENKGAILQINGKADARSGIEQAPIFNPNIRVIARYEPDTSHLYILQSSFKEFCVKRQIPYNMAIAGVTEGMKFLGKKNVRIMKGTGIDAPPVPVLWYLGTLGITPSEDNHEHEN
jgi:hypothetical protein